MSLRVLLADESSSIKKAFELALQDYQVKVQTVHQGADVTELHESFQPDICFMDIMLPKVNGYDACNALKQEADTPVVLMWSGFMELDSEKFQSSGADGSIEKPFETKNLRALVQKLVPSLSQNEISQHLIFDDEADQNQSDAQDLQDQGTDVPLVPDDVPASVSDISYLPDLPPLKDSAFSASDDEPTDPGVLEAEGVPPLETLDSESASGFSELPEIDTSFLSELEPKLEDDEGDEESWTDEPLGLTPEGLDDVDAFSVTSLNTSENDDLPIESLEGPEGLDLPPVPAPDFGLKEKSKGSTGELRAAESLSHSDSNAEENHEDQLPPLNAEDGSDSDGSDVQPDNLKSDEELIVTDKTEAPKLSKEELKRLILAQSKDIIESVVWDVVPELAKEMIQKEINRLTGEVQIESDLR